MRSEPRSVLLAQEFYIGMVHEGVVRYAREAGWILDTSMLHTRELPEDWRGDGILAELNTLEFAQRLAALRLPMVALSSPPPGFACPYVDLDHRAAGRLAAEHLIDRGFREFAFYKKISIPVVDERCEGFRRTVESAGHRFHALNWEKETHRRRQRGRTPWLAGALKKLPTPVGIMSSNDTWAVEVMNACRAAGLAVPEQVAVIGVDNNPLYVDVAPVPLTSVDNDLSGMGYQDARMLDRIMQGRHPPAAPIILPPIGVVKRRSTDILAVEDVTVAKAVGFMYRHFHQPIRIEDVAQHCAVSLRRLQELFKESMGRTMIRELTRLRLEHALRLLRETDQKAESIARQSGFSSGKYLNKIMMQQVGQGAKAYRRGHKP